MLDTTNISTNTDTNTTTILSFSGGKDSTGLFFMLLERGISFEAVFFDGGWEFPQMYEHLARVEELGGKKITILRENFDYFAAHHTYTTRQGEKRRGYGWPSFRRRWCTRIKTSAINGYVRKNQITKMLLGIAFDEQHRIRRSIRPGVYYPLVEWRVTEADALAYCKRLGFDWGGLYEHFSRVSCFCCPLKGLHDFRILYDHFPDLWNRMLNLDDQINPNFGFYKRETVHALDCRFRSTSGKLSF